MRAQRARLSRHTDNAKAMDYMLKRWPTFTRFLEDSRICLTNNAAERALRGIQKSLNDRFRSKQAGLANRRMVAYRRVTANPSMG